MWGDSELLRYWPVTKQVKEHQLSLSSSGFQADRRRNTLRLSENGTPLPPAYIAGRRVHPHMPTMPWRASDNRKHKKTHTANAMRALIECLFCYSKITAIAKITTIPVNEMIVSKTVQIWNVCLIDNSKNSWKIQNPASLT